MKARVVEVTKEQLRAELQEVEDHIHGCCMGRECPQVERMDRILWLLEGK